MKRLKRYLIIMLFFLLAALTGAVVVWYTLIVVPLKEISKQSDTIVTPNDVEQFQDMATTTPQESFNSGENEVSNIAETTESPVSEIIIRKSNLPESQQSLLTTFGFGEEIVITKQMQTCAEAKLGTVRLEEIIAGASPSFKEAALLATCLRE